MFRGALDDSESSHTFIEKFQPAQCSPHAVLGVNDVTLFLRNVKESAITPTHVTHEKLHILAISDA